MVQTNGKSETSRIWADKEKRRASDDRRCNRRTRRTSAIIRGKSFSVCRADWTQANSSEDSGGSTFGGIVEQLINETFAELQETELRAEKLQKRLSKLKILAEGLKDHID